MLATGQYASLKRDDIPTVEFTRFARKLERLGSRSAENHINRHVGIAVAIHMHVNQDERLPELHARLLAGQGDLTVAAEMDLEPSVVRWYADLCFDVRPRLGAKFWIVFNAIGTQAGEPPAPLQLFLQSSYHHGPAVIPGWLDYLENTDGPHDLTTKIGRQRASIALFVESHRLTFDRTRDAKSLRLARIFSDFETEKFKTCFSPSPFAASIQAKAGELSFAAVPKVLAPATPVAVSAKSKADSPVSVVLRDTTVVRDALYEIKFRSRTASMLVAQ
jgi:hypothetical protein